MLCKMHLEMHALVPCDSNFTVSQEKYIYNCGNIISVLFFFRETIHILVKQVKCQRYQKLVTYWGVLLTAKWI